MNPETTNRTKPAPSRGDSEPGETLYITSDMEVAHYRFLLPENKSLSLVYNAAMKGFFLGGVETVSNARGHGLDISPWVFLKLP